MARLSRVACRVRRAIPETGTGSLGRSPRTWRANAPTRSTKEAATRTEDTAGAVGAQGGPPSCQNETAHGARPPHATRSRLRHPQAVPSGLGRPNRRRCAWQARFPRREGRPDRQAHRTRRIQLRRSRSEIHVRQASRQSRHRGLPVRGSDVKVAVIRFPGANCDQDGYFALNEELGIKAEYVWHESTSLAGFDGVFLPGGFSYGDYLRCG